MAARACGPRKSEMAALYLSATRPLVLGTSAQIGAPFTAIKEAEGQTDANALTQRFSGFAIQLWDRLVGFRDFFALVRARASHAFSVAHNPPTQTPSRLCCRQFLLLNSIHLAIVTRMSEETNAGSDCAVNSWVISASLRNPERLPAPLPCALPHTPRAWIQFSS